MITSINGSFAHLLISTFKNKCTYFFFNFYFYIIFLFSLSKKKKTMVFCFDVKSTRENFIICNSVSLHASTYNSYIIWLSSYLVLSFSLSLSLLLQGYLSFSHIHSYYDSLLNLLVLITPFYRQNRLAYRQSIAKFRAHPAPSFLPFNFSHTLVCLYKS